MTASPALLAAIAEICAWHNRIQMLHPMRTLPSGRREPILPPEIPDAIRLGEIEVPEELQEKIFGAVMDADWKDWPLGALKRPMSALSSEGSFGKALSEEELEKLRQVRWDEGTAKG